MNVTVKCLLHNICSCDCFYKVLVVLLVANYGSRRWIFILYSKGPERVKITSVFENGGGNNSKVFLQPKLPFVLYQIPMFIENMDGSVSALFSLLLFL